MYIPPFTCRVSPVIYAPSGEQRKATAAAISAGWPSLPKGICAF